MEQQEKMELLELIVRPAFCVKDGVIFWTNKAAEEHLIPLGAPIDDLISTGKQEYADFSQGCLYLSLELSGSVQGASVTRVQDFDVFLLEEDTDQAELRAMSLTAQNLREPLSGIMAGTGQLFSAVAKLDDPAVKEQFARINRDLFQMLRILGNMSDANRYCKNSAARQEIRDVTALMEELFRRLSEVCPKAGINLRFTNLGEPVFSLVDGEKLERAVYNILSNAMKFTPKGGYIDAKLTCRDNRLYLTVQDSGQGISENLRSSVYHRYMREPGIDDGRHGIGLGMVLIRATAMAHGGTVLIEQPENQGMRLTMTMAIRQNPGNTVRSPVLRVDYAGEWDHCLLELSDSLPAELYQPE